MENYWAKFGNQRIARRRALVSGSSGLAGALLAACGSKGSSSAGGTTSGQGTGLLSPPEDTSRQAKRGGIAKDYHFLEPSTFDPVVANSPLEFMKHFVYSWLLQFEQASMKKDFDYNVVPDLMESWEFSPDKLQLTLKMRQGVKWHNKPPINGRAFDVDDVLFSWERLLQKNGSRAVIANSLNPAAPIVSMTAPDARTIVVKLAFPLSYVLSIFAYTLGGSVAIVPKETDSTYDIRSDMIGTGPFILAKYEPSTAFNFKRNPDYYEKDRPWLDEVQVPILTEYATQLAQLRAGNIYNFPNGQGIRQEDVIPTKKDVPQLKIYQGASAGVLGYTISFGFQEPGAKSPWQDERLRRAFSMAFDRDAFMDVVLNVSRFEAEGLPVETKWNTGVTGEGWWLDPKNKDFGPNAQYFQHNIAEARKLLAAAGFPDGIEFPFSYPTRYQPGFDQSWEIATSMLRDAGLRPQNQGFDYVSEYIPKYSYSQGKFAGAAFRAASPAASQDPMAGVTARYYSKAAVGFAGFDASGRGDGSGDPYIDSLIEKDQQEFDTDKRKSFAKDFQRYQAGKQYVVHTAGDARGFDLAWPCLRNYAVFPTSRGSTGRVAHYFYWLDETLPPFKSS